MTEESLLPKVGPQALKDISALVARSISQPFTEEEIAKALFAPDQAAVVRFDPAVGVVASLREGDQGHVRLIAVAPEARSKGFGHALVETVEVDLKEASVITFGADPPYFLFPGVPVSETGLCYLLERHHYSREEANYNVVVNLSEIPDEPTEGGPPDASERDAVAAWAEEHWPNWRPEFLRAFDQDSLHVVRDGNGYSGLCAFDVNRSATLGPIASRPDLMGKGASRGLLTGALRHMREMGYSTIEVLWVAPLVPYVRVGGVIGRIFFVYRKRRWT
ncbi:MAG: GNAT family N-acetyltransferase [Acidimicrobiales bacterium]